MRALRWTLCNIPGFGFLLGGKMGILTTNYQDRPEYQAWRDALARRHLMQTTADAADMADGAIEARFGQAGATTQKQV